MVGAEKTPGVDLLRTLVWTGGEPSGPYRLCSVCRSPAWGAGELLVSFSKEVRWCG